MKKYVISAKMSFFFFFRKKVVCLESLLCNQSVKLVSPPC